MKTKMRKAKEKEGGKGLIVVPPYHHSFDSFLKRAEIYERVKSPFYLFICFNFLLLFFNNKNVHTKLVNAFFFSINVYISLFLFLLFFLFFIFYTSFS